MNGSEILLECLLEQGVDTIFGYPGGAVLNIYDALYKYQDKITHYLTSHEQGASHAADGYARATGRPGVCLATSGPGATNLVTGIATAYMDSSPVVAITGNVAKNLLGKDSFQEIDIKGITTPITKHNYIVKDAADLADTVREAFFIAQSGRPGPVLVDITKDVTAATCEYVKKEPRKIERLSKTIKEKDLNAAIEVIKAAKRPFIYAGGGVGSSEACEELRLFAEKIDAPVGISAMGVGCFPSEHPLLTGMIGMHGTKTSNVGVTNCDLLIAVGARFSDRVISNVSRFAPLAKIIHIDIDAAEIDKNVTTYAAVVGDAKLIIQKLNAALPKLSHAEWVGEIKKSKEDSFITYKEDGSLKPQYILERINKLGGMDSIVATDVGQHQMWACQYIKRNSPRSFLTSGGLGTMGFGLGAAIGAQVAFKEKTVFLIAGDGCFRMNNAELATAVEYNLPVIACIFNNRSLGMVRQWQKFFYDKRYSHTTLDRATDFVALAKAYGAGALNVVKKEEVDAALTEAISSRRPYVINFEISKDENVFPMVPPGAGIDELFSE
jgi:acetolactate synthase-1/2/3 large subunit